MKKIAVGVLLSLMLLVTSLQGATISGKVLNQMQNTPIAEALVILQIPGNEEFSKTAVSDATGFFLIEDIGPGKYNIEVARVGYFKNVLFDLKIEQNRNYDVKVKLLKQEGEQGDQYCFMLGGIEVCSVQQDIIPEQPVTTRKIDTGEIEHMQATSLGDILSLVPGVEKSQNPGLSKPTQIGLRSISVGGASVVGLESFGSAIIIDGNQLNNEANLTTRYVGGYSTSGIDLRNIPADNIKSVEVITGIPSVEYGNFANGLVKVETKTGYLAPKLKVKLNPDTKTASFSHGINLCETLIDYHLNYGYSERDLRKVGDEYQRFHGNMNISRKFLQDRLETILRGSFTKMLDDEEPTDIYKIQDYNRGYLASGSVNIDYTVKEDDQISVFFGFNLNRKKAFRSKLVTDQLVLPDTIYSYYVGKLTEIGMEWDYTARLQRRLKRANNQVKHDILLGAEWDYQKNTGEGFQIDPVFNYYGAYSSRRSFAYNDYPDLNTLTFYAEDVITARFLNRRYTLMLGLRYDIYDPLMGAFLESAHGSFLCPRFNVQYFITENFRIRAGAGRSSKGTSLGFMYQQPTYFKYATADTVIEEMHMQYNPQLQTYSTNKYELSLDWRVSSLLGFSLTGYYQNSDDQPSSVNYPWGYEVNPDTLTSASYSIYRNVGWNKSSGVEFLIRTKRVHNLQFNMNITYRFSKSSEHALTYDSSPDTTWEQIWYPSSTYWREKVIIDYQLSYISKRLGVWVTFDLQQIPLEHYQTVYNGNSTIKDGDDGLPHVFYQSMTYWYDKAMKSTGGRWLFNFRLSKSLTQKTELSVYINNVLNDRGIRQDPYTGYISEQNPEIYYGLEVSTQW